jgi:hypothetical protein
MAGTLALKLEILGEFKKLSEATQGANKALSGMNKQAQKVSKGIKNTLGAIGVGLSFVAITNAFKSVTEAAEADAQGQKLLTIAIENNTSATKEQVAEVHDYIDATELASAVTDDELRPALGNLIRATGDTTEGMRLLDIALDVSAGTGKNLGSISEAMSKALKGNVGALKRLIPTLNETEDPMTQLARAFAGANEEASKQRSWQRFQIVLERIREEVGTLLLPALEAFAQWFTTTYPKIESFFDDVGDAIGNPKVQEALKNLGDAFNNLGSSLGNIFGITQSPGAKGFAAFFTGVADTIRYIVTSIDFVITTMMKAVPYLNIANQLVTNMQSLIVQLGLAQSLSNPIQQPGRSNEPRTNNQNVTINVNNGNVTADQIANSIRRANKATGTNILRTN